MIKNMDIACLLVLSCTAFSMEDDNTAPEIAVLNLSPDRTPQVQQSTISLQEIRNDFEQLRLLAGVSDRDLINKHLRYLQILAQENQDQQLAREIGLFMKKQRVVNPQAPQTSSLQRKYNQLPKF